MSGLQTCRIHQSVTLVGGKCLTCDTPQIRLWELQVLIKNRCKGFRELGSYSVAFKIMDILLWAKRQRQEKAKKE